MSKTNTTIVNGTKVISTEDGQDGTIMSVCSLKRNGSPFSYRVQTIYGIEVWDASEILAI